MPDALRSTLDLAGAAPLVAVSGLTVLYDLVIVLVVLVGALSIAAGLTWFERRLLGFFQDRLGPNRVGPAGLLQPLADTVKMFTKEDWIPPFADAWLFVLAPTIIIVSVLLAFVIVPLSGSFVVADINIGLLFFLAMSSLGVYSVALAGWSSASKYSIIGGLRAAAQMMSYEVFMGVALTGVGADGRLVRPEQASSRASAACGTSSRSSWGSSSSCWPASPRCGASRSTWSRPRASSWRATAPSTPA